MESKIIKEINTSVIATMMYGFLDCWSYKEHGIVHLLVFFFGYLMLSPVRTAIEKHYYK
jgi:hypothetical protein